MSSIDPATMAKQLATFDVQSFKQRYTEQSSQYQSQLNALGKVESALREFRTAVNEMNNSTSGIIKTALPCRVKGSSPRAQIPKLSRAVIRFLLKKSPPHIRCQLACLRRYSPRQKCR